ncbi:MAG: hypothetical protein IPK35_18090 [Saprospiraceae bacterium]|jgi:hypothetical protein|nr:hypothetical protein [Saprospiraceae bacterium]
MDTLQIPEKSKNFTPLQLELLKLYANNPPEEELMDIKRLIEQYYSKKLSTLADENAKEHEWSEATIESILNDTNQ